MAVDFVRAKQEIDNGLAAVCAMCEHYYENPEPSVLREVCRGLACGGPSSGGDFRGYKGEIPRERFKTFCFVCLNPKISQGLVYDGETKLAVCKEHIRLAEGIVGMAKKANAKIPLFVPVLSC